MTIAQFAVFLMMIMLLVSLYIVDRVLRLCHKIDMLRQQIISLDDRLRKEGKIEVKIDEESRKKRWKSLRKAFGVQSLNE